MYGRNCPYFHQPLPEYHKCIISSFHQTLYDKLITSNQTCTYELEWDAIKRVKCSEFHTFWPFSYDSTRGIKMEVFQDLKFSDKEKVNTVTPVNEGMILSCSRC